MSRYLYFFLLVCIQGHLSAAPLFADTLVSFDKQQAGLAFSLQQSGENHFEATFTGRDLKSMDTLELSNPSRLVFDFPGVTRKIHEEFTIQPNDLIRSLRVGSHPSKFRMVFDLQSEKTPYYSISAAPGKFIVRFSKRSSSSVENNVKPAKPYAKREPAPIEEKFFGKTDPLESSPKAMLKKPAVQEVQPKENKPTIDSAPVEPQETAEKETPTQNEAPLQLRATGPGVQQSLSKKVAIQRDIESLTRVSTLDQIEFKTLEPQGVEVLSFVFSREIKFKLVKENSTLFRLSIDGTQTGGSHVELPYFAPKDFPGIESVQVRKKSSNDLDIEISTSPDTRLSAFQRGTQLFVRAIGKN